MVEYKLNRIDTDLRNIVNEQTKEGKIHSIQNVEINNQALNSSEQETKGRKKEKKEPFSISKYSNKKKIEVTAYKGEPIEITAQKEPKDESSDRGLYIDIRR